MVAIGYLIKFKPTRIKIFDYQYTNTVTNIYSKVINSLIKKEIFFFQFANMK